MLSENREYHFAGELTIEKSHVLAAAIEPKDDKVNWLFLKIGDRQFSFVYRIEDRQHAQYKIPFKADLAFTMIDAVKHSVELNCSYDVLRGQEYVGKVKLISILE